MKTRFPRWIIATIAMLVSVAVIAVAQRQDQAVVSDVRPLPEVKQPLPFGDGETMKFDVKFARFPVFASVGEMTFNVSEEKPKPDQPNAIEKIRIHAEAVSKGALVSLFGIHVKDVFESIINKKDLGTYTSTVNTREGKRNHQQVTTIERDKQQITYVDTNLNAAKETPKVVKSDLSPWPLAYDPVAAIYFVRTQNLEIGKSIKLPVSDEGKAKEVELIPARGEDMKVGEQTYKTIKLEAKVFNGALFNGNGQMYIWVSDDKYHVPIKFQIKAKYGTITGNLISRSYTQPQKAASDKAEKASITKNEVSN
ncbi:MAG TPA: DUF3108 domain-containing protein [Blastocatellia bacterium]|nr:DUF3108 domain-containing protein [Blastocatellia bacterium]